MIVTRQAKSRTTVAKMLGFNRNTISEWFGLYEAGGLEKLLDIYKPGGAKPKITKAAVAEIQEILQTEKGFRTYKEIHQLVAGKHQIAVSYRAVHDLVRYKLEARIEKSAPRKSKKNEAEVAAFKDGIQAKFTEIIKHQGGKYKRVRLWTLSAKPELD